MNDTQNNTTNSDGPICNNETNTTEIEVNTLRQSMNSPSSRSATNRDVSNINGLPDADLMPGPSDRSLAAALWNSTISTIDASALVSAPQSSTSSNQGWWFPDHFSDCYFPLTSGLDHLLPRLLDEHDAFELIALSRLDNMSDVSFSAPSETPSFNLSSDDDNNVGSFTDDADEQTPTNTPVFTSDGESVSSSQFSTVVRPTVDSNVPPLHTLTMPSNRYAGTRLQTR